MLRSAIVKDGTGVIARVAKASIDHGLHVPDETWMRCMAHLLKKFYESS